MEIEQTGKKSFRTLIIVAVIGVTFMAVIGVVVYALMVSSNKQQQASSANAPAPWPRVATKEEVNQNLTDLNTSLKQSKADQDTANAAVKDNEKQIKVGN
jgi:flagellar basal body-associated protein FliL